MVNLGKSCGKSGLHGQPAVGAAPSEGLNPGLPARFRTFRRRGGLALALLLAGSWCAQARAGEAWQAYGILTFPNFSLSSPGATAFEFSPKLGVGFGAGYSRGLGESVELSLSLELSQRRSVATVLDNDISRGLLGLSLPAIVYWEALPALRLGGGLYLFEGLGSVAVQDPEGSHTQSYDDALLRRTDFGAVLAVRGEFGSGFFGEARYLRGLVNLGTVAGTSVRVDELGLLVGYRFDTGRESVPSGN